MKNEIIEKYKKKLEEERESLITKIEEYETPKSFGDDIDHFEEKTNETEDLDNHLAMAGDLKKRVDEIDIALSKIKNGGYGICEKCGGEIEGEVLSVNPESPHCKTCSASAE